jgi:PAS domain S-box-containing protein
MSDKIQTTLWLDAIQVPLMVINRSGKIIAFNHIAITESAVEASQVLGKLIWDTPLKYDAELKVAFPLDAVASTLTHFKTEGRDESHINWSIRSAMSDDGQPQWVCTGTVEDHHVPPYHQMFEHNPAVMLLIDPQNGHIIDANGAATRFYGYSVVELVGTTLQEITSYANEDMITELKQNIQSEQDFLVFQHRTADGRMLDVEIFPSYVELGQKQLMYCVIVDVTDRNLIEDALRSRELQYRRLVELMQEGLVVHDSQNVNTYVNDKLTEMLGYSREDLMGHLITDFMTEDNAIIVNEQSKKHLQGMSTKYELAFIHKNEQPVYVLVASTPIIDDDGIMTGSFSVITDISEQKFAEDLLRQSNAELDAFAQTVAHDLKSPIAVVMGFANVLETEFASLSDNELKDYLRSMARTSDKMITIIDELLLLSEMRNIDEVSVDEVDMAQVVQGALERLDFMSEQYGATIIVPPADSWILIQSHGQWIEEVWVNYISNAIKYGGQPPQVEMGCIDEGDRIRFWVKDNGRGIPEESLDEIFMPFTRLEQVRIKGHGLGLSIVQRIINKLGGDVAIDSVLNEGSVFSFLLPRELMPSEQ